MTPDREKVIRGLESCLNNDCHMDKCPYCEFVGNEYVCLENFLMRDALALLKDYDTQLQYRDDHIAEYEKEIKRLEDLLHKKEKDIDKLCVEISRLKHQIHDNEPTFEDWTKGEGR